MAKELTDVYKTLQRLSFHFGTTLRLLSVSYKIAAERAFMHSCRRLSPFVAEKPVSSQSLCTARPAALRIFPRLFHVADRAGFTATCNKGRTEKYPPPSAAINQLSGGRFDDKDFKRL